MLGPVAFSDAAILITLFINSFIRGNDIPNCNAKHAVYLKGIVTCFLSN
jgi:hypothetical protein